MTMNRNSAFAARRNTAALAGRAGGLALLAAAGRLALFLQALLAVRGPRPVAFLVALAAVVLLTTGLALVVEGTGLCRRVPRPPRALLP